MPLTDLFDALRSRARDSSNAYSAVNGKLLWRVGNVLIRTWDLGFTAFGGPPVHFQIEHRRFVEEREGRVPWIDEQVYQELFGLCQALPGPGSTKMLFCVVLIHAGAVPAIIAFLLWSLPGSIGMYALALGVRQINDVLPGPVYAFLSGLNASTVGIVALAAVQLAEKCIKDPLTRGLVIGGATAGLCYTALWYFPILILIGGIMTVTWDLWLRQTIAKLKAKWERSRRPRDSQAELEQNTQEPVELTERPSAGGSGPVQRKSAAQHAPKGEPRAVAQENSDSVTTRQASPPAQQTDMLSHAVSIKIGIGLLFLFAASFIAVLVARAVVDDPPRPLDVFANMYLAGTIIFGGGPVVIPLLREYTVVPGWVAPRDFLIGLAIIQAFPGPNFNFAVFLGALAVQGTSTHSLLGAFLGYVGIFVPGIVIAVGFQSFWRVLRVKAWVVSILRGINATAVGLVFTAVYRLWQIGYLTAESNEGRSLAEEPWWVVVAVLTYAENAWYKVPAPVAILIGGILGLCWYGVVQA